jgi:hypothetical protein
MFQRGFGLEQGGHVHLVLDAEQLGEIERGQHGLGCSHSAISMRIGASASMWCRICAMARNWRIAVLVSIASAAKLTRSGFTSASSSRRREIALLLAMSSVPSGSIRRRKAL